jgi:hypothetical protein
MTIFRLMLAAAALSSVPYAQTPASQDERFDLNIKQEQIVETNFERAKSIAKQTEKVRVEAGAAVSASRIDVTLRGVTGNVRFRARFDALERLFRGH